MTLVPIKPLRLAGILCGLAFLAGCGDSDDDEMKSPGGGSAGQPPGQKAIYLRGKEQRPPGTKIRNRALLTMTDATLLNRIGDETVHGKITTGMRDVWGVEVLTENQRSFTLEESSFSQESEIDGQPREDRVESTLTGIEFQVARADDASPWLLSLGDQKLTGLQELEMKTISDLWKEESRMLYPEEPLELGQSWKADPKAFGAIFSPRLKVQQGEVICRLDEITVLRGERCGAVSVDVDITGTFTTPGGTGMNVQIALTGTIMRSLYKFFDMRTELKGSMQLEMAFPDENREISIDGVAEFLRRAEIEPASKSPAAKGSEEKVAADPDEETPTEEAPEVDVPAEDAPQ